MYGFICRPGAEVRSDCLFTRADVAFAPKKGKRTDLSYPDQPGYLMSACLFLV